MDQLTKTIDWLYSLEARGEIYKLERMEAALEVIGNPHRRLRAVHIAGTKGKGSVAAMLDSCLRARRLSHRALHQAASGEPGRADADLGRRNSGSADARLYRAAARDLRPRGPGAHVFRIHRRDDVPLLRRRARRYRDRRDRTRRAARFDQCRHADSERDHADRFRSHGISRLHDRGDRGREGRHHQARRAGRDWRARRRGAPRADVDRGATPTAPCA